jgi:hypothetical protein
MLAIRRFLNQVRMISLVTLSELMDFTDAFAEIVDVVVLLTNFEFKFSVFVHEFFENLLGFIQLLLKTLMLHKLIR